MQFITPHSTLCGKTGTITHHTAWHCSLTLDVNEGQQSTTDSWLLPLCSYLPDTLFAPPSTPQTGLLEGSVATRCLSLYHRVNLSRSRHGSPQLDTNQLRHYEMNENFLFELSLFISLSGNIESRDFLYCGPKFDCSKKKKKQPFRWIFEG